MVLTRTMKRKAELECDAPVAKSVAYDTFKKAREIYKKLDFPLRYANKKNLPSLRFSSEYVLESLCHKCCVEANFFNDDYLQESENFVYKILVNVFFTMTENNQPVKLTEADIWVCLSKEITGTYFFLDKFIMQNREADGNSSSDTAEFFADIRFSIIEKILAVYTGNEFETFGPKFGIIKTVQLDDDGGYLLTLNEDFMQVEEYPASPEYETVNV